MLGSRVSESSSDVCASSSERFHLDTEAYFAEQTFVFGQRVLGWVAVAFTQVMHGQTKAADLHADQCTSESRFFDNQMRSVPSLDMPNPLKCLRLSLSFVAETSVHTRLFFVSRRCASQSITQMLQDAHNGGARGSKVPNQDHYSGVLGWTEVWLCSPRQLQVYTAPGLKHEVPRLPSILTH
jgi:hypothetical protein